MSGAVTHEGDGTAMATLLPGMLVNARVRQAGGLMRTSTRQTFNILLLLRASI